MRQKNIFLELACQNLCLGVVHETFFKCACASPRTLLWEYELKSVQLPMKYEARCCQLVPKCRSMAHGSLGYPQDFKRQSGLRPSLRLAASLPPNQPSLSRESIVAHLGFTFPEKVASQRKTQATTSMFRVCPGKRCNWKSGNPPSFAAIYQGARTDASSTFADLILLGGRLSDLGHLAMSPNRPWTNRDVSTEAMVSGCKPYISPFNITQSLSHRL